MTWRDKTCEDCTFRVGRVCRRFPITLDAVYGYEYVNPPHEAIPDFEITGYAPACAEHATDLQQLTIKDVVR